MRCLFLRLAVAAAAIVPSVLPCQASGLGTIVPAYFYPGTGGPGGAGDGWAAMAAAAAEIPLIAIFNPNSGPLTGPADPNYVTAMTNLETSGGKVVAYIYTANGSAPLPTLESQIDTYITQYGSLIDGFFLDGMNLVPSTLSYYQSLDSFIEGLNSSYTVAANPGQPFLNGVPPNDYLSTANLFDLFEGDDASFASYPDSLNWFQSYSSSQFSNIVYDVPSSDVSADLSKAAGLNAGYVYLTDQTLNPPSGYLYDQLPSYWDQEVADLAATATPEPATAALFLLGGLLATRLRKRSLR